MRSGKLDTARIRTENMILEDVFMEVLEILELYAETVSSRLALVERQGCACSNSTEHEPAVAEQVAGLMYAAPHTDVRELHILREQFEARYGEEYTHAVDAGEHVAERVARRLTYTVPPPELVDACVRANQVSH